MKLLKVYILLFVIGLVLVSCDNDNITAGTSGLTSSDEIIVKADTFSLHSYMFKGTHLYITPDSLLLGESDNMFGTMKADILTQLACPLGYKYPSNAVLDSAVLFIYYSDYYGSGKSPIRINVYEMDKQTFDYSTPYYTDTDISDFCSLAPDSRIITDDKIVTALGYTDSVYSNNSGSYVPSIRMKLTDAYTQKLFTTQDFTSQEEFNDLIKGIYITTDFGSATMLYVTDISIGIYYSFSYEKSGRDTIVHDVKGFYANSEVRQLNRYEYRDTLTMARLNEVVDSVNYIVSPANIYTTLSFPLGEIRDHILSGVGNKRPYINRANLRVPVLNVYEGTTDAMTRDDWSQPATPMLLIKREAFERFFHDKELPSDTFAIYSQLNYSVNDTTDVTTYYYTYDMSSLLTMQLRDNTLADTLHMVLVPVTVTTSYSSSYGTTSVSGVTLDQRVTATTIPSAQSKTRPLQIEVVYSGF